MLEKMLGSFNSKAQTNSKALEDQVKLKLKGVVYDDELVEALLPTFMKLQGVEGFSEVMELLESKEQQIETISGGNWFKKESSDDLDGDDVNLNKQNKEGESSTDLVDELLKSKYEGK